MLLGLVKVLSELHDRMGVCSCQRWNARCVGHEARHKDFGLMAHVQAAQEPEREFTRLMWIIKNYYLLSSLAAKQCMQTCLCRLVPFATNRLRDIDRVN
jgi:hypothetical protein